MRRAVILPRMRGAAVIFVEGATLTIQLAESHHSLVRAGEPVTEFEAEGERWKVKLLEVLSSPNIRIKLISRINLS